MSNVPVERLITGCIVVRCIEIDNSIQFVHFIPQRIAIPRVFVTIASSDRPPAECVPETLSPQTG